MSLCASVVKCLGRTCRRPPFGSLVSKPHRLLGASSLFLPNDVSVSRHSALTRDFQTNPKKKERKNRASPNSKDGRILVVQGSKVSKKGNQLCVGCGVQVMRQGSSRDDVGMISGSDAVQESGLSKRKEKLMRFVDVSEGSAFLCKRCKALRNDNVWKAYDALHDVSPEVFAKQLQHIVGRRRFGLCILVVDSTDPEHSAMKKLRKSIGNTPCILVFTKVDLVPRMSRGDQRVLRHRVSRMTGGVRFLDSYAVSSVTGKGIFELAEGLLGMLHGRDVFVVGSANVGKSTLVQKLANTIGGAVYMKGKKGKRRRDLASNLQVTGSHLPGTTLQAVRIPCFSKPGHALWDTPGIINTKAIQYSIFPSHLMEPLARPAAIPVPTDNNELQGQLHAGDTLLVEAGWMEEQESEEPCVLARLDLVHTGSDHGGTVFSRSFLHPSLRVRLVPTEAAPDNATIPRSYMKRINQLIPDSKLKDEYSIPLKPFISPDLPEGKVIPKEKEWSDRAQKYFMDICFASLGWISLTNDAPFTVIPHVVQGSIFTKRKSLYPVNVKSEDDELDLGEDFALDKDTIQRRLQDAARSGRHHKSRFYYDSRNDFDDDEWH